MLDSLWVKLHGLSCELCTPLFSKCVCTGSSSPVGVSEGGGRLTSQPCASTFEVPQLCAVGFHVPLGKIPERLNSFSICIHLPACGGSWVNLEQGAVCFRIPSSGRQGSAKVYVHQRRVLGNACDFPAVSVCLSVHVCVYVYVCLHVSLSVCICVSIHMSMCLSV